MDEIVTYLEMTGVEQLRAGRETPGMVLEPVENTSPLIRDTQERIAAPYGWLSLSWSDDLWRHWLDTPLVQRWIVRHGSAVAGLVELEAQRKGQVELTTFGLVPEFVGRGLGGHALTMATLLAWNLEPVDESAVRRVWLHTSNRDHPNALPNYLRRGFQIFDTRRS
jgi:GNAT superfamily N-acetyltransferase